MCCGDSSFVAPVPSEIWSEGRGSLDVLFSKRQILLLRDVMAGIRPALETSLWGSRDEGRPFSHWPGPMSCKIRISVGIQMDDVDLASQLDFQEPPTFPDALTKPVDGACGRREN